MKFKILEIHKDDAYHRTNDEHVNKVYEGEISKREFFEGWKGLDTNCGKCFIGVKLEKVES